ncbi:MAG: hypothetical protein BWY09_02899 [Candidatus Hydrogenedentes bacterium ADurb.Bin179]|nr:MAG: hypothetical protein BWY09_02899 [Candidatus Hydrogenedentes bacterium ADurb.Bin179]
MGVGGSLSVTHTVAKQEALRPRISVTVTSMSSWGMALQSKVLSSSATFQMGASDVVALSTYTSERSVTLGVMVKSIDVSPQAGTGPFKVRSTAPRSTRAPMGRGMPRISVYWPAVMAGSPALAAGDAGSRSLLARSSGSAALVLAPGVQPPWI